MAGNRDQVLRLQPAAAADLVAVNRVVSAAVAGWDLPARVKRLALPLYHYTQADLAHLQLMLARDAAGAVVGVVAWEPAGATDAPPGRTALLLQGLYVDPASRRRGIGRALFAATEAAARAQGLEAVVVRAQKDAGAFFAALGMQRLAPDCGARGYANRYWKRIG